MKHGKNLALLLCGMLLGGVLAGSAAGAAEKLTAQRSTQAIYVDGQRVTLEAYAIGGNNYVKLRDIGKALNFNVYWDGAVRVQSKSPYTGEAPSSAPNAATAAAVTEARAKQIALSDAGLAETDVSGLTVKTGTERGVKVYEVEFFKGAAEYDYDISMTSGEIVSKSQDAEHAAAVSPQASANTADAGKDAAISAALTHAGVKRADTSGLQAKLDFENGRRIYEVEFHVGRTEYSYDVDAASGEIVNWEKETD